MLVNLHTRVIRDLLPIHLSILNLTIYLPLPVRFILLLSFLLSSFHFNLEKFLLTLLVRWYSGEVLQLLFLWKTLYPSFNSEEQLCQVNYSWLAIGFFSFSTLNIACYSLLACKVSANSLMRICLHVTSFVLLLLRLSFSFHNLIMHVSVCLMLSISLLNDLHSFSFKFLFLCVLFTKGCKKPTIRILKK